MNSNTEVPVQMVMPELNAGQPMQNENTSTTQSTAVIHSTMTMAQSPLQQQMQAIQQNLNANSTGSVQMVMSELNTQVQMVQNENIPHSSGSQTTLMHPTATMAQAPMQHVQVIPQAMSAPYFQSVYSPQQQVIFPGNLTLHTGTGNLVQSLAQNPNVQLQTKQDLLNKVSVTGPTYQIVNAVTTKAFPNQNLIAKPLYSSVNSPTQVSNASQLKQMTSQPQMITSQASGTIYQPQVFSPFTQLPQNITWATPGTYQSPTLLSANVIIRNQHPEMFIQPSPQTTMIMPVGSGATHMPGGFTYALVQPQKPQQISQKHITVPQTQLQKTTKVRHISPSVATQTITNEKMKIAIPRTRVNQNVRPKSKITVPLQYNATISSILPQQTIADVQNQAQLGFQTQNQTQLGFQTQNQTQLGFQVQNQAQLGFQLEMDTTNQTLSSLTKSIISTESDSPIIQNHLVGTESTQSLQHLPSKPNIINAPTSVAQIINSTVSKPIAMVIASTVNTTAPVNSVVTTPTFITPVSAPVINSVVTTPTFITPVSAPVVNSVVTTPTFITPVSAPVVSSVETPVSIPLCPSVSCSVLNDGNVLSSIPNSLPMPETNFINVKSASSTIPEAQVSICDSRVTDSLKAKTHISTCDQRIIMSKPNIIANISEQRKTDTLKSQTQVITSEQKAVNVFKSQTCNAEQQTAVSISKAPIGGQKNIEKLKLETHFNNSDLTTNILKPEKQAVLKSDASVPETNVSDYLQRKDEENREKNNFSLDIVIKKEPVESSPAIVENDINFKAVSSTGIVVTQADSSAPIQNEHDKPQTDNQHNTQTKSVPHTLKSTLNTENNAISQVDIKSKTLEFETSCIVTTENKPFENLTSDSTVLESKAENSETEITICENVPIEQLPVPKEIDENEHVGRFFKNLGSDFIEQNTLSKDQGDSVSQGVMSPPYTSVGKQKQRLKAVVRPHILTHVIDGFVIYESSEPFPVNRSALMSDSCTSAIPKFPDNCNKKIKNSKHLTIKNPDEPTKPDDLKEPNEPTKTDFPKKRSDRIKLMETQKQLDLKKSEPKKPSDSKKAVEPKTPNDQKKVNEPKTPVDLNADEPKKVEDLKNTDEATEGNDPMLSPSDVIKPNQADTPENIPKTPGKRADTPENIPKTPGKRGRKRKELRSKRGRKKLIPDGELNNSNVEIIIIDGENGPESDVVEDEAEVSLETPSPVQAVTTVEAPKTPVHVAEESIPKPSTTGKGNNTEDGKNRTFSEKLPTEWSVEDVCDFVRNIPNCQDYAEEFKSQEIDGKALLLLKVDHIVTFTSMKFGPALKLISLIDDMKEKYSLEV